MKRHISKVCFKNVKSASANAIEEICVVENPELRGKFKKLLEVNGRLMDFDVDSGAAVTLMFEDDARRLFRGEMLYKTDLHLVSYCKNECPVLGFIKVLVEFSGHKFNLNIDITKIKRKPIIEGEWMRDVEKKGT